MGRYVFLCTFSQLPHPFTDVNSPQATCRLANLPARHAVDGPIEVTSQRLHLGWNFAADLAFVDQMVCNCSDNAPNTGKCVLIVEDNALIAMAIEDDLLDHGLSSKHVACCEDALDLLLSDTSQFAAAILDIELGGNQTSEPIAKVLSDHGLPFVFHSGEESKMENLAKRYNAMPISKPADTCVLSRSVQAMINCQ